jgi:hypothetical protein
MAFFLTFMSTPEWCTAVDGENSDKYAVML